ncbi:MAG: hypothetical protein GC192_19160 [Bacteroidetes bacterium]|nr:hypothetical protein [Bacteroidota bacterium]
MVATTEAFKSHILSEPHISQTRISVLAWSLTLSMLALQFLPQILLWDEAYIRIHDTLEGIDYENLFASGKTFDYSSNASLEQVMNGLPRAAVKTGWSFVALWHWLFGLYGGYLFNYVLVHIIAFGGMLLLLRNHFLQRQSQLWIVLGISLCFSWLPFFTMLGLSVAGQPLVALALLNFWQNRKVGISNWLIVCLFPFYADIVWAGIPILLFGSGMWLYQFWKINRINWYLIAALGCMGALFIAANWQLFQLTFFATDFVSHRLEYDYFYNKQLNFWQSLLETFQLLLIGYHHVGIMVSAPIILAVIHAWKRFGKDRQIVRIIVILLSISTFFGFYKFLVWAGEGHFVLLKSFKFERIMALLPLLWMLLFALVLSKLEHLHKTSTTWLLIAQFVLCIFSQDEFTQNIRQLAGHPRKPNFKAFFDEELFTEINEFIGTPKANYRVVSLGMHPSVAQFNGFYTLDLHASMYDLRYKHQFRKIMAGELAKSEIVHKEFDQFGNRCYLFSAELGKDYDAFLCGKNEARSICQLDLNSGALCEMGGCYLFSAVKIENAEATGLRLANVFEGRFWEVNLYEVTPKEEPQKNIVSY